MKYLGILSLTMIVVAIAIYSYIEAEPLLAMHHEKDGDVDINNAREIRYQMLRYMYDSNDWLLTFGDSYYKKNSVERIMNNLSKTITINNKKYGPYLHGYFEPQRTGRRGWEINVRDDTEKVDVDIFPNRDGDSFTYFKSGKPVKDGDIDIFHGYEIAFQITK